jgi:DNA-directed RNA polymerase subunit F
MIAIGQYLRRKTYINSTQIAHKLLETDSPCVSPRTVRRTLAKNKYDHALPKITIPLTDKQKMARVKFAKKYKNMDWKNVIFSDESMFQTDHNVARAWMKKSHPKLFPKRKFPLKMMVWAGVSYSGKTDLAFVDGRLNAAGYVDILKSHLLPFGQRKHNNNYIFQQDNAPIHTARFSKAFFDQKKMQIIEWPANSPDLNPIENIWGMMKMEIAKLTPNTKEELKSMVEQTYEQMSLDVIRNTIDALPGRLAKVIQLKGGKADGK